MEWNHQVSHIKHSFGLNLNIEELRCFISMYLCKILCIFQREDYHDYCFHGSMSIHRRVSSL